MSSSGDSNPGYGYGKPRYPGTFLLALREALGKLNWQAVAWKGILVECVDGQERTQQVGLENLYRRVRREPRGEWSNLLAELLGSVVPETANLPASLHEVADQLLVRLGSPYPSEDPDMDVWTHPLVPHRLVATLVIDYPSSMTYVTKKMIDDSSESGEDWLQRGLANLLTRSDAQAVQCVHEESGLLQAQFGDAYDSSRALLLDDLLPGHEENGFFVIVPGRDHLLMLPLSDRTLPLAPWLRAIAAKTYQEMPYPISPDLYWVRCGIWHYFEIVLKGEEVFVKPPAAFEEVMERLHFGESEADDDANDAEPPSNDSDAMPF